jgi:hypothetical protein
MFTISFAGFLGALGSGSGVFLESDGWEKSSKGEQSPKQGQSQIQSQSWTEKQEPGWGDKTLLKLPGFSSENGNFDNAANIPLASPDLASAQLVLSSQLSDRVFSDRALALELAPAPMITRTPTPTKTSTLEHRSSATLARWVKFSSLTPGVQNWNA